MATTTYGIPEHVRKYIKDQGYTFAFGSMEAYIKQWDAVSRSEGTFWDWNEVVNGALLKGHRRSVKPAKRVCKEWARLLFNDKTDVTCDDQQCTDRLREFFRSIGFYSKGQRLIIKAFELGTIGWALWLNTEDKVVQVRRYNAKQIILLSYDDDGVSECAFACRVNYKGKEYDQLTMYVLQDDGYHIITKCWTVNGKEVEFEGVINDYPTNSSKPWFSVFAPIENDFIDDSPYGQSLFCDAVDQIEGVDLTYDAMLNEVDVGKMRVFMSDMLIDVEVDGEGRKRPLPFGRDNVVFRKVNSTDDLIQEFAPALRTESQIKAYRAAWQSLGDACGFGLNYFDVDDSGGLKTATEVSSDNSTLMNNIRMYENNLEKPVATIAHAVLEVLRSFGEDLPDEGNITVTWDDSIITDTAAEKSQDMAEVGTTLNAWEYRMKWYGEDEETAKANVPSTAEPTVFFDE